MSVAREVLPSRKQRVLSSTRNTHIRATPVAAQPVVVLTPASEVHTLRVGQATL